MAYMKYRFRQIKIFFESVGLKISGNEILNELSGFIDTDLVDFEADKWSLSIAVVTSDTEEHILKICDEVKKSLEKTIDDRLLYKVVVISL
jgi:tRNA threonylcarbamoyladenosine modification (KEOPS) complex Cgi121 subunit